MARAFMVRSEETFQSVLDHSEEGDLPVYRRRRRMRDGGEVWATVRSHPDPVVRLFLETVREAGVIQAADRVRALWSPKLIIIATDLPVDLTVDALLTRGELIQATESAARTVADLRAKGWSVRPLSGEQTKFRNSIFITLSPVGHHLPRSHSHPERKGNGGRAMDHAPQSGGVRARYGHTQGHSSTSP
jgi:hypothetical protein